MDDKVKIYIDGKAYSFEDGKEVFIELKKVFEPQKKVKADPVCEICHKHIAGALMVNTGTGVAHQICLEKIYDDSQRKNRINNG